MNRPHYLLALSLVAASCARSPETYLERGKKFAAEGRYEEAAINFRKVIAADVGNGEGYYQLGLTLLKLKRSQEAYEALSTASQRLPDRDDIAVKLGDVALSSYLSGGRRSQTLYAKVAEVSNRLLVRNVDSFDGLRLKGHLAASDKKYKEAEDLYAQADRLRPLTPEVVLAWTEVLLAEDRGPEAEALAFRLIAAHKDYVPIYEALYGYYGRTNRRAEAEKLLRQRVANNPSDSSGYLQLAAFYAGMAREADLQAVLRQMASDPKTFPKAHLQTGDLYRGLRRWDEALREYSDGMRADPKDKVAYLKRSADIWLLKRQPLEAEKAVDQVLAEQPQDEGAVAVKTSILIDSGKPEKIAAAVARLKGEVEKNPKDAALRFNLARGLELKGDLDEARMQFVETARVRPDLLPARVGLLELDQRRGDFTAALRDANQVLAMSPNLPQVRLMRVVSLMNTGNEVDARAELARLERALPGNFDVQLQVANLDLRTKKYAQAESGFRALLRRNEGEPRALTGLTRTLVAEKREAEALSTLEGELKKAPNSLAVRSLLADTAAGAGQLDLAIAQYQAILAARPESAVAYLAMGTAYFKMDDARNAEANFEKARALAPKDPEPLIRLADVRILAGRKAEAIDLYRSALKLKPDHAVALGNAAYLIADTGGNLDEALTMAQSAVRLAPDQEHFADTLGWVYFRKGLNDSAVQVFRGLTEKYPENETYHYHLGMALSRLGDRPMARKEFTAALAGHPSEEIRRDAAAALAR